MDKEILRRLELLNQLRLTEEEKQAVSCFVDECYLENQTLDEIDTTNVDVMVHVMPIMTVVREDKVKKLFSREDLQQGAPETDEGYWCVPRVIE